MNEWLIRKNIMPDSLYIPISHKIKSIEFIISFLSKINISYYYLLNNKNHNINENYLVFVDREKECIISINDILEYEIENSDYPFMVDLKDNNGKDLTLLVSYLFCNYFGYIVYNDCGVLGKQDSYTSLELFNLIKSSEYYYLIQQLE